MTAGVTVSQLLGNENIPAMVDNQLVWTYQPKRSLVRPELVKQLSTQMYRLHTWYKKEVELGRTFLMVKVKAQHFFNEKDLWIENPEFWQLYNQDALDKSVVSCYSM